MKTILWYLFHNVSSERSLKKYRMHKGEKLQVNTVMFTIKSVIKATIFSGIVLLFFVLGQASQYFKSSNELRDQAIESWLMRYPKQSTLTYQFIERCINEPLLHQRTAVYGCGRNLGAYALVEELQRTDQMLIQLAWPLSLFEHKFICS
ncbi:hypothetical protein [Vibrio owensii]|uniref:hypothetical protein n=1 Tax=Vibrio owensii TaxID=696485 RepID=UPI00221EB9B4|nr:hypothetical protein [Vibrio owensii]